ncbi:erythrocyte membrane protein 1, PfEMP1, putative [Plasmodium sp.]|nr:erythrocyte membrane protein 1, PfEMP1, putative [Plasmodium sp.]
MARGRGGGAVDGAPGKGKEEDKYKYVDDAKHLLDMIGKDVYEKAKNDAEKYKRQLKGTLSQATFEREPKGPQTPEDPCQLEYQYHTNATNGRSYPCRKGTEKRFSEVSGSECDDKKIEGNVGSAGKEGKSVGACAPFRRLHLCVRNLENISNYEKINKDTLLADVCLAALHEGAAISADHGKYQETNDSSQLCTMLARSFADIGDIIRGKDLYRGNNGKDKLQDNLKKIFKKIHEDVMKTSGRNGHAIKARYKVDAEKNYFQLREDWWYANREKVWKAIRCGAPKEAKYFIKSACGEGKETHGYCRCIAGDVPTYFDYVPQYLRWFEEWGEDFCRLRKHKLENAINKCRYDENNKERYCDLNGYDCTETARGKEKYNYEEECIQCSFSCTPFTNWIDIQKQEFEKQKEKYGNEIKKEEKTIQGTNGKINNIYEKDFYERLKTHYGNVNEFLQKLNDEAICKKPPKVVQETADPVDFTKSDLHDIFSHTKYCQACPLCGLQSDHPPWQAIDESECRNGKIKTFDDRKSTEIDLLVKDKGRQTMMQKLKSLCNDPFKPTIQKWKCHYVRPGEDYCVLQDDKKDKPERTVKQYEAFFNLWIDEMLDDSIKWRNEHGNCINNKEQSKCIPACKKTCDCFEKWVVQKKTEWEFMEKHFDQQEDLQGSMRNTILKYYLDILFKEKIKKAYGEDKWEELNEKLEQIDVSQKIGDTQHSQDAIKILLQHEEDEAKTCLQTQEDCKKPQQPTSDLGRSETPRDTQPPANQDDVHDDDVHDDEITQRDLKIEVDPEEVHHEVDTEHHEEEAEEPQEEEEEPPVKVDDVNVCATVAEALTEDNLKQACQQKYEYGREKFPNWKCISDSGVTATGGEGQAKSRSKRTVLGYVANSYGSGSKPTGESDSTSEPTAEASPSPSPVDASPPPADSGNTATTGGLCIPPRRRKLYVTPLMKWAEKVGETHVTPPLDIASPSNSRDDALLKAFVESAAVETFFLWHKYKVENTKRQSGGLGELYGGMEGPLFSESRDDMQALAPVGGIQPHLPSGALPGVSLPPPVGDAPGVGVAPGLAGGPELSGLPGPKGRLGDSWADSSSGAVRGLNGGRNADDDSSSLQPGELENNLPKIGGEQQQGPQLQSQRGPFSPGVASLQAQPLIRLGDSRGSPISLVVPEGAGDDDGDPNTELKRGHIPIDFLRLMFYTLGDYRDICVGNTDIVVNASGTEDEKQKMKQLQQKIDEILKQSGEQTRDKPSKPSENPRKKWWDDNAKYIWEGMICALTYRDSGARGKTPEQDSGLKSALLDNNNKPKKDEYQYNTVTLKDYDENGGPKLQNAPSSSGENNPTTLTDFIKRPPYFRYLEEWGETFCRQRTRMLEKIEEDCKVGQGRGNEKVCSGYGENCDDNLSQKYDILPSFNCHSCGEECRKYRKWIGRKKIEFEEQKSAYGEQKKKCEKESNMHDKEFCTKLTTRTEAAEFLKSLASCSKNNNDSGDGAINFKDTNETFKHTNLCDPCSKFKINCKNDNCRSGDGDTKEKCNGTTDISPNDIGKRQNSAEDIGMLVSDNSPNGFEDDLDECLLPECADAGIFEGIRKDEWICGTVCGYNVCKPKNSEGKKVSGERNGENQIILITAFVKHWVENFLEDYNKIRKKINPCTKNDQESKCISGCKDKCKCVVQWISKKKKEWEKIQERFLEQYKSEDKYYAVKIILEDLQDRTEFKNAIKPCKTFDDFKRSCGLNGADNSKKSKDGKEGDLVLCLIEKLETKAKTCVESHTQPSDKAEAHCQEYTSFKDDDDEPFEEEENPVTQPNICPPQTPAKPEETEETCDAVAPQPGVKEEEEEKEEEKDKGEEEEEPEPPPPAPAAPAREKEKAKPRPKPPRVKPKPQNPWEHPIVIPSLATSTLMWTVGIGFAAFTYFFLKKKTKSSVGNLFQILQIPKSDYEMPTLKSSNRYIPYVSDRHKGKTYIYMEGDSSGDEKYAFMSDTTDVTSSESEYEEMDINDIYVPGSPKYKTLIEVVLEPSKRDIQSDDIPMNKFSDDEWNQLKHDFISNMLQNQPKDIPNDYKSGDIPLNTQPNTLYFDKPEEKPFITSIHDRNLYTGEEYNYNVNMVNNDDIPINRDNNVYSGIDLINDSLNNNNVDIYDELLKRKENELFGTNHPKHTNTHNVTKSSNSDPIDNQLDLFHTWLDRHRDMCENWNNKEEVLDKLKEEWNKDNNSGDIHTSDSNKTLNTDVSIQIHMDNPKPINEFTNMDTILEDLEKYNDPYYDVQDDIYYDVNDHDASTVDTNAMDVPSKVQIEMDVNSKLVKEKYPIADVWDI